MAKLKERWNNLERRNHPSKEPQFHRWFHEYKATDFTNCAILEVRKKAGLLKPFTTNSSESLNHVLKHEVDWEESKLPVLVSHLRNVVIQQVSEMEKSVISHGEWKFSSGFTFLSVDEHVWFSGMNHKSKMMHIKKVNELKICQSVQLN